MYSVPGGPCAQRLAARLIPRFLHRFPHRLDAAAAALAELGECRRVSSTSGENDAIRGLTSATRCDALEGFNQVFQLASNGAPGAVSAVQRAASFLLRSVRKPCTVLSQHK